jgi:hypothetical protein
MEHSSYSSYENIVRAAEEAGFRDTLNEELNIGYLFNETPVLHFAPLAYYVSIPFGGDYERIFNYEFSMGTYEVSNRYGPHIDELTREPLHVTNILIQHASSRVVDGAGRREITTIGSGRGYLMTYGRCIPVLWEKESDFSPTRWYFEDGEPLRLNPGKTWICVFHDIGRVVYN